LTRDRIAIVVNGESLVAHASGALWHGATRTLVVSDLHFEKGSAFAARGSMLPPYDTRETLRRLDAVARLFNPLTLLSLGDAFHDAGAEARMDDEDAALLDDLSRRMRLVFVFGNHDPAPPARVKCDAAFDWRLGALLFRHLPETFEAGEIVGLYHPAARVRITARLVRGRCFVKAGERLVMPAFGAYAGGLDVLDPAFPYADAPFDALLSDGGELYAFPKRALVGATQPGARAARRQ
jgi:hypothetical protein